MDAIYGCGTSYLFDNQSRVEYYKHLGRWDKVSLHYDIELSMGRGDSYEELINALKHKGFDYLASNSKDETNILETNYECAWRLNNWTLPTFEIKSDLQEYEKYHYLALHSFHNNDNITMNQAVAEARKLVLRSLSHASLESSKNLYKPLMQLQSLTEIENFIVSQGYTNTMRLLNNWKNGDLFGNNEFIYTEPIHAQRVTILKYVISKNDEEDLKFNLASMYLKLADEAHIEGLTHISERALANLSCIENLPPNIKEKIMFQKALMHWVDDKRSGQFLLGYVLSNTNTPQLKAAALKQYGNWMVETRSENPQMIIEKYFKTALDIMKDYTDTKQDIEIRCQTMNSLAMFADAQYQEVLSYMTSAAYQNKLKTIDRFREMARNIITSDAAKSQDFRRAVAMYERQRAIDETEVKNKQKEKDMYLTLAVSNYLQLLEQCDSYNLIIFRILSLCLSNKQNEEIISILKEAIGKISSYKFMPILPQVVPHIGYGDLDLFERQIYSIIERCMVDHPHHTLPIIIALAESYKDREFDKSSGAIDITENRVLSAQNLITKYKKHKDIGPIIKNMEILSTALISFAYLPREKCTLNKKQQLVIPKTEKIKSIKNMQNVLIPTINLPVSQSRNYTNIIGIYEYESIFTSVGGVNEPKKIICKGTDGINRAQLVKGKDDLRQDAVMQQVFTILNTLLAKNKQTSKLHICTYKVTPLSQRSGIIEWCENTEPLGVYLPEAHKQFYPSDWSSSKCRKQLQNAAKKTNEEKFIDYMEICDNFRPVFHKFFTTLFSAPTVWYERRRAYMHSVATSSMIGYILGLGDRHVQNILIDKHTAEVIHIDFGKKFVICFDS